MRDVLGLTLSQALWRCSGLILNQSCFRCCMKEKEKLYALRAGFQLVVTAAELVCCSTLRINRIIFLAPAGGTGCSVTTCLSDDDIGQCLQRKAPMKGRKRGGGFSHSMLFIPVSSFYTPFYSE